MTQQAKQKIGMFGALIAAAILGAAAWEMISGMTRPAMAQQDRPMMDDPRNATQYRLQSIAQYKELNEKSKELNDKVQKIYDLLNGGKLKVIADVPQLDQKPKPKRNSQ